MPNPNNYLILVEVSRSMELQNFNSIKHVKLYLIDKLSMVRSLYGDELIAEGK